MKARFEKALLTNEIRDEENSAYSRIYFGSEFCQNLIPSLDTLKKQYFLAKDKDQAFTFVTSYVTNAGLEKLDNLLSFLNDQQNVEVVFNDWGVFKLIKDNYSNLDLVLGRLLTKQRRDPRMLKILEGRQKARKINQILAGKKETIILIPKEVPSSLFEYYRGSVINAPIFQKYLLSQDIKRVEIDNLVWKMSVKVDKRIRVSIYLPYGYITTTRMCGRLTLTYESCKKECKRYFIQLEDSSLPVPFYIIGNTIFYQSETPSDKYLEKLGIDRVVYQPRLVQ